jgi:hypothetical protein
MKEYYRILQVDPLAEQEVIEAAYRRLLRKYHPDVLSPDERNNEEVLQKVRNLNEAYEVLADGQKRQEYDLSRGVNQQQTILTESAFVPIAATRQAELENRIYLIRCATTKRTFKMFLGRRVGWSGPFVVMGFEPIDSQSTGSVKGKDSGLWNRLLTTLSGKQRKTQTFETEMLPTPEETFHNLLDIADTLSLGDIEWAGQKCPDCAGEIVNPNGTRATWSRCGTCHHLRCVGNSKRRLKGFLLTCPWCGAINLVTRSVATGSKEQAILRGKYHGTRIRDLPGLTIQKRKSLGSKKES